MSFSPTSSSCTTSVPATGGAYGVPRHMPTVNPVTAFFYSFFASTPGGPNATNRRPLTLAEEARRRTEEAQREIKLKQEAEMKETATYLVSQLKGEINKAASCGYTSTTLKDIWDRHNSWMRSEKDLRYFCTRYLPAVAGPTGRGLSFSYSIQLRNSNRNPEQVYISVSW